VEAWACRNNLQLNRSKCVEIVFSGSKRSHRVPLPPPPPLPDISRVTSVKILHVTVSSKLSDSDHVQNVISSCVQTLHALRLLRAHGLCDVALQTVYHTVVICKLLYVASVWWGFATSADRQRIEAFLRRGVRTGYRRTDEPTAAQLVGDRDDELFDRIRHNVNHVLHPLLPNQRTDTNTLSQTTHLPTLMPPNLTNGL